jgi:hypothetical protein
MFFTIDGSNQWTYIVAGIFALFVWMVIDHVLRKRREEKNAAVFPQLLRGLPFFYSFHTGKGRHLLRDGVTRIWADATYTLVAADQGIPVGVIGFEYDAAVLRIYQLQGLKGVNVRGVDLGNFLLSCAEGAARKLHCHTIRVQPARYHVYYELDEDHPLYSQLYQHQERLRRMYDGSSKARGYIYCRPGYFNWYQKQLRKRLTVGRWLRLQMLLYERVLREAHRSGALEAVASYE